MTDLSWTNVDVTELPETLVSLYDDYKAAQRLASEHRAAFEAAMIKAAAPRTPPGKSLVFGYKFGKLSIAWGEAKATPAKPRSAIASIFG